MDHPVRNSGPGLPSMAALATCTTYRIFGQPSLQLSALCEMFRADDSVHAHIAHGQLLGARYHFPSLGWRQNVASASHLTPALDQCHMRAAPSAIGSWQVQILLDHLSNLWRLLADYTTT
jgi:hypothetical protein